MPPSIHPDTGKPYRWTVEHDIAEPPPWLLELVTVAPPPLRPTAVRPTPHAGAFTTIAGRFSSTSIADDYCATVTWRDVLGLHGWSCLDPDGDADGARWLHPAATSSCSATVRHRCLFVYSDNTPFDVTAAGDTHGYTKFRAYAVLDHSGDLSAAAHALKGAS